MGGDLGHMGRSEDTIDKGTIRFSDLSESTTTSVLEFITILGIKPKLGLCYWIIKPIAIEFQTLRIGHRHLLNNLLTCNTVVFGGNDFKTGIEKTSKKTDNSSRDHGDKPPNGQD